MEMKNHVNVWFYVLKAVFISMLFVVTACVSSPQTPVFKGEFIAGGRVEGLEYKSGHKQGLTDSTGAFYFSEGDTVEFFLGGVRIGYEIKEIGIGKTYFSPFDLINDAASEAADAKKDTIVNIMRLLQSLDIDGNYGNGIHITEEIRDEMKGMSLSFNVSGSEFEANAGLVSLLSRLNGLGILNGELKSYATAKIDLIIGMIQDEDAKPPAVLINLGDDWVSGTQSGIDNLNQYTQVFGYAHRLAGKLITVFDLPWSNPLLVTGDDDPVRVYNDEELSDPYNLGVPGATTKSMLEDTTDTTIEEPTNTVKFMNELFKPLYDDSSNLSQLGAAGKLMENHDTSFINIFTITVGNNDIFRVVFNEGSEEGDEEFTMELTSSAITDFFADHGTDTVEDNLTSIVDQLKATPDSYIFISNLPDIDNLGALFNETDIEQHATFDDCDVTSLTAGSYLGFNAFMDLGEENEAEGTINLLSSDNTQLNDSIAGLCLGDDQVLSADEATLIQDRINAINTHINDLALLDENVVLVDINGLFENIENNTGNEFTVTVNNYADDAPIEHDLSTRFGGGVFSLDGITPSHTGYALVANEFIEIIQDTLKNTWAESKGPDSTAILDNVVVLDKIVIEDEYNTDPYRDYDDDGYVNGYNLLEIIPVTYHGLIDCDDENSEVIAPFDSNSTACLGVSGE